MARMYEDHSSHIDEVIRSLIEIAHQISNEGSAGNKRSIEIQKSTNFLTDYILNQKEKLERLDDQNNQNSQTIKDLREANRELMQRLEMTMLSNIDLQEQLQSLKQDQLSESW